MPMFLKYNDYADDDDADDDDDDENCFFGFKKSVMNDWVSEWMNIPVSVWIHTYIHIFLLFMEQKNCKISYM